MKYGVHRLTWGDYFDPKDLHSFFKQVKQTGADTVEMRPVDEALLADKQKTAEVRKMAESENVELIFCFGYPLGVDMRSDDVFARNFASEHLKRAIEASYNLGGKSIGGVLYSNWPTNYDKDVITKKVKHDRTQRCIECLNSVSNVANDFDITVNLEILNRFENYIINTVDEGLELLSKLDSNKFNLTMDIFHLNIEEDDIFDAFRRAKGRIGQVHLTEPNRRLPFHNKRFNWPDVGNVLKEIGYDNNITLEAVMCFDDVSSYNLRQWRDHIEKTDLNSRIAAMKESILFLKHQFNSV